MPLRDYQKALVTSARNSLSKGNHNVLVQSPAGSGKTVTMAEIAKDATSKGNHVLFIVHRREIVDQVRQTFDKWGVDKALCQIGMVQTITNRLEKIETPKLILVDEAHHSLAKTYKRIFEKFEDANVIGFTATPVRLSGKGLKEVYDDLILGPEIQWLIDNRFLAPFNYYSVNLIDNEELKKSGTGDFTNKSIDNATKKMIYGDVINEYKRIADNTKTIVYTHNVAASVKVSEAFNKAGYSALQVDGKTAKEVRSKAMADFKSGKVKVLVNADLYGEGVDVPDCQTVIMLRPTESLSLFIQQSMRCMRFKPGKQATIIDHVANYTRFGLPNTPHKWTLADREKKKKSTNTTVDTPIKQCAFCFAVIPAQSKNCPLCGHEVEVVQTEIKVDETARIEKIESNFNLQADYIVTKKISELKSYEELKAYAKARGYKQGWIYFQAKNKGLIKGAK